MNRSRRVRSNQPYRSAVTLLELLLALAFGRRDARSLTILIWPVGAFAVAHGGVSMAIFYPWGSSWFASNLAPYLWSIFLLNPEINYVAAMPWLVKFVLS